MKTSGQIAQLVDQLRNEATINVGGKITVLDEAKLAAAEAIEQLTTPTMFWAHDFSLCAYAVADVGAEVFSWGAHDLWGKPVRFRRMHALPDGWAIPRKDGTTPDGTAWKVSVEWHPSEAEALASIAWPKVDAK
jgi:hypothetical protein